MERVHHGVPRPGWQAQIISEGMLYANVVTPEQKQVSYWREGPFYRFLLSEQKQLEEAAKVLLQMCVDAGDYMIANPDIMRRMGIPESAWPEIKRTWIEEPPSVYGRFDFRFGGNCDMAVQDPSLRTPKLLEFNADTPTTLFESALTQWNWLNQAQHGDKDQWNFIHEALIAAWKRNISRHESKTGQKIHKIHFVYTSDEQTGEDLINTSYLADTAEQAGYQVKVGLIEDLEKSVSEDDGSFYYKDWDGEFVQIIFKLYPWEWLTEPAIAPETHSPAALNGTVWIEPPWKQLWSNKGLLAVLWKLFKDDSEKSQYLLPAYFADEPHNLTSYVRKPLLSREGANITIVTDGEAVVRTNGQYGSEGYVVQQFAPLPNFHSPYSGEDHHPMLGVWMIDGEPAGMGIRESGNLITNNSSFFAPHTLVND